MSDFLAEFRETATKMGAMEPMEEAVEPAVEDDAEFAEEVGEEVVEDKLYLGRYKTPEDLEIAYSELERKLGEQSSRIGDANRVERELSEIRAQLQAQTPAANSYDLDEVSDWFDNNPMLIPQTAQQAMENQDWTLYNAAMEKWHDLAPRQASAFERQYELAALKYELEGKLATTAQPIREEQHKRMAESAVRAAVLEFPEMNDESFAQTMREEAQNAPWLLSAIETGDPSQLEQALRSLALMARGRRSGTLVAIAQKDGRQQQRANNEAKQEAAVLSATSAPSREPVNGAQAWKDAFRDSIEFKKSAGLV